MRKALLLMLACCVSAIASPRPDAASISIVVSTNAGTVERFAAQELGRYLKLVTGKEVAIGDTVAVHHIYVGNVPAGAAQGEGVRLRRDLDGLGDDGFAIRSIGPDVAILGKGSRGTLYGCYAYLEKQGVRWFFPGKQYEIVPRHAVDWRHSLSVSESPSFPKRILFYWPNNYSPVVDWIDFCAKVRLNRIAFHYTWPARDWYILLRSQLLPELEKRGMEIEVAGHFLSSFLPRTLFPQHHDWFRMNEQGQRSNDFNLNPFNPEALDYLASGAVSYLQQMPEAKLFHLWADDIAGGGWSREPGKEDYTASDQSLLTANFVVKKLREKLPNADLAYLAYHDTVDPPHMVKPEPGLIYFYAPRERCYAHALNDPSCELNRKYAQALENGMPAFGAERAEVFEYYADQILYENMTNPPLPEVVSADLAYYHKLGIPAVGALMTNTSNFITPLTNMFLYPQGLWDLKRDLRASLREYATLYFGDSALAGYLQQLSMGLEGVLRICRYEHPGDAWDEVRVEDEPEEALEYHVRGLEDAISGPLARAASDLENAVGRAKGKPYRERLQGEQVSMHFTLCQAKLYYHLLKGEQRYRAWKRSGDEQSGLDLLTELALARYTWESQKAFVATAGMKANPLMPGLQQLQARAADLSKVITLDPDKVQGVNEWGFSSDRLEEHLMNGVLGEIFGGPSGSSGVVWTDLPAARKSLRAGGSGLVWRDELGQPLNVTQMDLYAAPVVVEAKGIPADKLFDELLKSQ